MFVANDELFLHDRSEAFKEEKKSNQTKLTDNDSTEYDFKIFMLTLILIRGLRVVLILYPYNLNDIKNDTFV